MNSEWSLDVLYKGYDAPEFADDLKAAETVTAELNEAAAHLGNAPAKETILKILGIYERQEELFFKLFSFCSLNQATNTQDEKAAAYMERRRTRLPERF